MIKFKPSDWQLKVLSDKHRFRVICAGRRSGKSVLARMWILGLASSPGLYWIVSPTYKQCKQIHWRDYQKEIPENWIAKKNEVELSITLKNGSIIELKGADNPDGLRGVKLNGLVVDEVAFIRDWNWLWGEVLSPTLTDNRAPALFISTPKGFNHFYDLFNVNDEYYKSFRFSSYDNPFLPIEEIEREKSQKTEDIFAQEYLADFRKYEGLVYKEFDRDKHLFDDHTEKGQILERFAGIDFGYTNPACVLAIEKNYDNTYWVTDEWYKKGQTETQIAEYTAAQRYNFVYPDPENPSAIEELKRRGVNVRDVIKGKDSVMSGINKVRELFKANKIRIHKNCVNLINELETYAYEEKKPGKNEPEKPIKERDHACFISGTKVNGKDIADIGIKTGNKKVYEYIIGGEKIISTKDHPVCTHRGFVNIDSLRYNDIICKNKLFMTVSSGVGIQTVKTGLIGITISALKRLMEAKERDYIDIYGKKKMELSRKDSIFITLTAIPLIIKYLILNVLIAGNTGFYILRKKSENFVKKISKKLLLLLQNGAKQKRGKREGAKLENKMQNTCQDIILRENAIYVNKNIYLKQHLVDGVVVNVRQGHYVGVRPVYSLRTKSGMFRANGILVSNCDALRYSLTMNTPTIDTGSYDFNLYSTRYV